MQGPERTEARVLATAGMACWLLAAVAAVWELLAQQSPESPYYVGLLAGPVGQLRGGCFSLGVTAVLCSLLWPWLFDEGRGRYWVVLALLGTGVTLGALGYAAVHGTYGIQVIDPRPRSQWLLRMRVLGHGLLVAALCDLLVRAVRRLR